jgi:tRNA-binding protein
MAHDDHLEESLETISYEDFLKVDIRTGRIIRVEPFPKARKPAYKLWIDLGGLGIKKSSAQIVDFYQPDGLVNKMVVAVVNFPTRQVADFVSEVLILGVVQEDDTVVLLHPERTVEPGLRIL